MSNHLFFVAYKMVNVACMLLSGQVCDAFLINIILLQCICSGCRSCVSEARVVMISFLLSVCHLGYSRERCLGSQAFTVTLCVEITAPGYLCSFSSLFLSVSLSPAGVNDCCRLPAQDNLLSQLEPPADSCLSFS